MNEIEKLKIEQIKNENKELKEKFKQITVLLPQRTKNIKEAKMLLNFDKLVADCARYKTALKEIDKKLELALDTEQTDTEESFDLLYEIQDILTEVMEEE